MMARTQTARTRYPERRKPSIFWGLAGIVLPIANTMFRYRITGSLPPSGPVILCSNHYSDLDPVTTGVAVWKLGRQPRFMAKASLFKVPVVGWVLRKSGQIPVERERGANRRGAMQAAEQLIAADGLVIIYPEGTLTREPDMWPMRGKGGAVRLALQHNIPIVPMATWGAQAVIPRFQKKFRFRFRTPLIVRTGEPIDLSQWAGKYSSRTAVNEATEAVMHEITRLLEDIRGTSAPAELYDPVAHGETEFGMPTGPAASEMPSKRRRTRRNKQAGA